MSKVKLGTVIDSCLGKMLDAAKNKGEYEPYLANLNVRWGDFDLDNLSQMRFESHEQERYGIKYGDLIMCEGGEPGRCAIWRDELPDMKIQKALHRIRPHDCLDVRYLYYWFLLAGKNGWLNRYFTETTIKHLPGDSLKDVEIDLIDLPLQKGIADVLSSLDDKIRHNNRICRELEAMAKTLYDYWFVQFDFPDENGKPYRASGGEMVWNERLKREIPNGWRCAVLSDFISIENASVNPATLGTEIMEHYSIPAYDDNFYPAFEQADTIQSGKYQVCKNSILVSKLNPQFKRIWDPFCISENAICSTEFMVYISHKDCLRPFCFALANSDGFYRHMVSKAISSTGSRKRIQPDVSLMYQFAAPNTDVLLSTFSARYCPIMDKIKQVRLENYELQKLRDWLLPMLMNGQARVE